MLRIASRLLIKHLGDSSYRLDHRNFFMSQLIQLVNQPINLFINSVNLSLQNILRDFSLLLPVVC